MLNDKDLATTQKEIDAITAELEKLTEKYVASSANGATRATLRRIDDQKQPLAERRDMLRQLLWRNKGKAK